MKRTYYKKPQRVLAFQFPRDVEEMGRRLLKDPNVHRIDVQPLERWAAKQPEPDECLIVLDGPTNILLHAGDWLVVDIDTGLLHHRSEENFRKDFFYVDTQPAVTVAPDLEDLL